MEIQHTKLTGCSKRNSKREDHREKCLYQETGRTQTNNLTLHVQELEKKKPKVSRGRK